ncbi:hypothetical protein CDJ56_07490 [Campylobacter jejuni]|nr:hypothetical protein [Campylobacter jejuni]EAI7912916.1 hypothetical protein [Campylobacter jejuni]
MQIQAIVFHKCIPKEVHQIYDTLKLMEQQEYTKKLEAKKEEKQSNTTNVDKADNKKDKFFRYICLILKQSFIYKKDWSKFFI